MGMVVQRSFALEFGVSFFVNADNLFGLHPKQKFKPPLCY
jgi:hypothetical protein